jgi:hypothetical protein
VSLKHIKLTIYGVIGRLTLDNHDELSSVFWLARLVKWNSHGDSVSVVIMVIGHVEILFHVVYNDIVLFDLFNDIIEAFAFLNLSFW